MKRLILGIAIAGGIIGLNVWQEKKSSFETKPLLEVVKSAENVHQAPVPTLLKNIKGENSVNGVIAISDDPVIRRRQTSKRTRVKKKPGIDMKKKKVSKPGIDMKKKRTVQRRAKTRRNR